MEPILVFVYGSLKSDNWNNTILGSSRFIGKALTKGKYLLTDVGFPYMIPEQELTGHMEGTGRGVIGEMYEVTSVDVLRRLDSLEGEGSHYNRVEIDVLHEEGTYKVSTYTPCNSENAQQHIVCGTKEINGQEFYEWVS